MAVSKLSWENTQPENMCDIIFENTKGIYAEATLQVSIVLVMKGELASETILWYNKNHVLIWAKGELIKKYTPGETTAQLYRKATVAASEV